MAFARARKTWGSCILSFSTLRMKRRSNATPTRALCRQVCARTLLANGRNGWKADASREPFAKLLSSGAPRPRLTSPLARGSLYWTQVAADPERLARASLPVERDTHGLKLPYAAVGSAHLAAAAGSNIIFHMAPGGRAVAHPVIACQERPEMMIAVKGGRRMLSHLENGGSCN